MNLACSTVCVDNGWCLPTASFEKVPGLRTDHALWWPLILETPLWCRYGHYLSVAHETKLWKWDWAFGNYQHHTWLTSGWTGIWTQNVELESMISCDFMTTARLVQRNHYSHVTDVRTQHKATLPKSYSQLSKWKWTRICSVSKATYTSAAEARSLPFNSRPSQQRENQRGSAEDARRARLHFRSGSQSYWVGHAVNLWGSWKREFLMVPGHRWGPFHRRLTSHCSTEKGPKHLQRSWSAVPSLQACLQASFSSTPLDIPDTALLRGHHTANTSIHKDNVHSTR